MHSPIFCRFGFSIWIALLLVASPKAYSAITDLNWVGPTNGDFSSTPANWGGTNPSNAYRAVIDANGTTVIANATTQTLGGLSISSGFTLTRAAGATSDRTFTIQAASTADSYFNNAGTISSGGTSGIFTISMLADVGTTFRNSGILEATAGTTLSLKRNATAPALDNTGGTIRTVGSGILELGTSNTAAVWRITGGNLTNNSGTINFLARNKFTLTNVNFSNGGTANFLEPLISSSQGYGIVLAGSSSLTNSSTGTINLTRNTNQNSNSGATSATIASAVATASVNNSGTINITTIGDVAGTGGGAGFAYTVEAQTLTNTGTINLESQSTIYTTFFTSTILTGAGLTLSGTNGELVLKVGAGGSASRLYIGGDNNGGIITQSSGHTTRGTGNLGNNTLTTFTNHGTVLADAATALTLDPRGTQANLANVGTFANLGTLRASGTGGLILNDGKFTNDGTFQIDAVSSLTINSGAILTNNATRTINLNGTWANGTGGLIVNNGSLVYDSSADSGNTVGLTGSGSLTKSGSGNLTLGGANTQTGGTTLNGGTLVVTTGSGNAFSATRTTAAYTLTTADTAGLVVGQAITGTGIAAGSYITGIVSPTQFTINNNVTSAGTATVTVAAYSTLGGGALTVNGGTLDLGAGSHTVGATTIAGGTVANGTLTGTAYDARSGSVSAILAGAVALTKTTAGTLVLSAANTYSGGTAITAGTLRVNNSTGSGTGSGAVLVGANGTLAGAGTLSGLVTTTATTSVIAPGNSPGTLTLSGGLDASAGTTFNFELGTTSDLILTTTFTGSLAANGLVFNFADAGGLAAGIAYTLIDYTSAVNLDYNDFFANLAPGWELDASFGTNGFLIDTTNSRLQVQFSAIPEPSTGLLILTGVGLALALRRRNPRHRR